MWRTSVLELHQIFRRSLEALVPELRLAKIPVGVVLGVDAWDEISETLYKHIVQEAIRWALPQHEQDSFLLPVYETDYEEYSGRSLIEVSPAARDPSDTRMYVFHSLVVPAEDSERIENVKVVAVSGARMSVDRTFEFRMSGLGFACRLSSGRVLESLQVLL